MAAYRTHVINFNTDSGTQTATITPAVNDLFVVFVATVDQVAVPTLTDNNGSGAYTEITAALKQSSTDRLSVWVRDALVPNTTSTIVTMTPGTTTGGGLWVIAVSGMSLAGIAAIRQSAFQSLRSSTLTPDPTFAAAALTANMCLGMVFNATNPAAVTPPASWTERSDVGIADPNQGAEMATRDSGHTSATVTWGGLSPTPYCDVAIELDTSSSGTTGTAASAFGWTDAATATEDIPGSGASAFGWTDSAATTVANPVDGTAASTFGWTDAATAIEGEAGTAASAFGWATSATGAEGFTGTSAAAFGWSDAAIAAEDIPGVAASQFGWATSATGESIASVTGTAASTFGWAADASAIVADTITGTSAVAFGWGTAAAGTEDQPGVANSVFGWSTAVTGGETFTGTSASAFGWTHDAVGSGGFIGSTTGTAASTFGWTTTASAEGENPPLYFNKYTRMVVRPSGSVSKVQ